MYLMLLSVKQGGIKYHFKVFGMMQPRIESISEHSTHWANETNLDTHFLLGKKSRIQSQLVKNIKIQGGTIKLSP